MLMSNRRHFLRAGGASMLISAVASRGIGHAYAQAAPEGPYKLEPLPYNAGALQPHIDATTMTLHHGKHHAAYVANLNTALKEYGDLAKLPLDELLAKVNEAPEAVRTVIRNNGGGHANHTMFWQVMGPPGPTGDLQAAIDRDLGGIDKLQSEFNAAGTKLIGSGWVFVTVDKGGKLALVSKPNQDTPVMEGKHALMGNDVWEHAYYLKYQNKRADYLMAWWRVVNWQAVGERYAAAQAGQLAI